MLSQRLGAVLMVLRQAQEGVSVLPGGLFSQLFILEAEVPFIVCNLQI
jgi:hypothetical protein